MTTERMIDHLAEYQRLLMEQASDDLWAAGWMDGLEEMMWSGSMRDTEEARLCRELARTTGVWIVWDDDRGEPIRLGVRDWIARHGEAPDPDPAPAREEDLEALRALGRAARAWREAWGDPDDSLEAIRRRIETLGQMIAAAEALPELEEAIRNA